jgi:hypothetical protein
MRTHGPTGRRLVSGAMKTLGLPRRPRELEDAEQMALMQWAQWVTVGQWPLSQLLWHSPNGGYRAYRTAARLKAMGVRAGVPDLQLPVAVAGYHGGWWELKAGDNKPTEKQIEVHALLRALGHYVQTYWHWSECANDILRYLARGNLTVIVRILP